MNSSDMGLLLIFDVIMTERSVTRAADRLCLSQPAVSNAVKRMRDRWGDEMFLKNGRDIEPSSFAMNLWAQTKGPLHDLSVAIDPAHFDSSSARRTFRICSVTDASIDFAWRRLRNTVEATACGIRVHTFPYHEDEIEEALVKDRVELVVGSPVPSSEVLCSAALFTPQYQCLMRSGHPLAKRRMSIEAFSRAEHLMVSSVSCVVHDLTDQALARHGMSRDVVTTVHHEAAVPQMVLESDLIAVVKSNSIPEDQLRQGLVLKSVPLEMAASPISLIWHSRRNEDLGLSWLRAEISRYCLDHVESTTGAA